jgi:hypothetical protein
MDDFSSRKTGYPHDSADVIPASPAPEGGEGWVVTLPSPLRLLQESLPHFWNSRGVKWIRLSRQTIQVWRPGVSITVTGICCCFSQPVKARLGVMR